MRVFVLSTGRCGSTTFARSCAHLSNVTAGHETLARRELFDARFDYPDEHVEVDNRLSWFLGGLGRRFDGEEVLYVHLLRDEEAVAHSFERRWGRGIIAAFADGIMMPGRSSWAPEERLNVCRFYVQTVTANIEEYVRTRPSMQVRVENIGRDFARFLDRIGAAGDLDAAMGEWTVRHNASDEADPT